MKYMKLCIHNYLNIVAQKNVLKNMLKPEIEKIYNKVIISHWKIEKLYCALKNM